MSKGYYLCYQDSNGFRGIVPPHTPYTLQQITATKFWLETETIAALIITAAVNGDCDQHNGVLGFVNDQRKALNWLLCDDDTEFIGMNNCTGGA